MGNGHMGNPRRTERQTDMTENITLPQLRWRAVIIGARLQAIFPRKKMWSVTLSQIS